jgi:hypothetical protein
MFDKIRSSLGISKKVKGQGQRLGVANQETLKSSTVSYTEFDVTFAEPTLGLQFVHPLNDDGTPNTSIEKELVVFGTVEGSESNMLGIAKDDIVLSVEGNAPACYDDFVMMVKALDRPLAMKFTRPNSNRIEAVTKNQTVFNLSSDQKEARRAAMQAAAENRAGSWDRKVKAGARAREDAAKDSRNVGGIHAHPEAANVGTSNPATQQAARLAQASEQRTAQKMGYNPFQPSLSASASSGQGSPRVAVETSFIKTDSSANNVTNSTGHTILPPSDEEQEQVDIALSLLLSSDVTEETVTICISTLTKLIDNLTKSDGAAKFCRIKKSNAAIQSRILTIPGGEALLCAAGFVEDMDGDEAVLSHTYSDVTKALAEYTLQRLLQLQ